MQRRDVLGVLGGLGPLASAAFLSTIYEAHVGRAGAEQQLPRVVLHSDPAFPDRTEALLRGDRDSLVQAATAALEALLAAGAQRLLTCCFTLHAVLPDVDERLRRSLISLPDTALAQVARLAPQRRVLLLATTGSRAASVFERSRWWPEAERRVVHPGPADQAHVHKLLYRLKAGEPPADAAGEIAELCRRHDADAWIAGCTELHLVSRHVRGGHGPLVVDPLLMIAHDLSAPAARTRVVR